MDGDLLHSARRRKRYDRPARMTRRRAVAWTKGVGQLTGLLVVLEVIVFALVLIFA
jgi:hypothetical protein